VPDADVDPAAGGRATVGATADCLPLMPWPRPATTPRRTTAQR
jgi:hypothetical protein